MKRTRGQALVETGIFLPLFIFALGAVLWMMREATMSERVQLGVRYSGLVLARSNPYLEYSLFALYDFRSQGPNACLAPLPSTVFGDSQIAGRGSAAAYAPTSFIPNCHISGEPGPYVFINDATIRSQGILLLHQAASIDASIDVPSIFRSTFSRDTHLSAGQNFFRTANLGGIAFCDTTLGAEFVAASAPQSVSFGIPVVVAPIADNINLVKPPPLTCDATSRNTQALSQGSPPLPIYTPTVDLGTGPSNGGGSGTPGGGVGNR